MKLKYRLRRLLIPHKHEVVVKEIKETCDKLKSIRSEIRSYDRLMKHAILGDALMATYGSLKIRLEHNIAVLD